MENYATFLMSIETARSTRTSTALTAMATSMINVGYILRDEAVRIVEARTFLVNGKYSNSKRRRSNVVIVTVIFFS